MLELKVHTYLISRGRIAKWACKSNWRSCGRVSRGCRKSWPSNRWSSVRRNGRTQYWRMKIWNRHLVSRRKWRWNRCLSVGLRSWCYSRRFWRVFNRRNRINLDSTERVRSIRYNNIDYKTMMVCIGMQCSTWLDSTRDKILTFFPLHTVLPRLMHPTKHAMNGERETKNVITCCEHQRIHQFHQILVPVRAEHMK